MQAPENLCHNLGNFIHHRSFSGKKKIPSKCPNTSVLKGEVGDWSQNGHKKDTWRVQNVFKKEEKEQSKDGYYNYWLLPDGAKNKGFTLDLGILKALNLVQVVNTHSAHWKDRATKKFKVYVR